MCQLLTQENGETHSETQILPSLIPSAHEMSILQIQALFVDSHLQTSLFIALEITLRFHLSVHNHKTCPGAYRNNCNVLAQEREKAVGKDRQ